MSRSTSESTSEFKKDYSKLRRQGEELEECRDPMEQYFRVAVNDRSVTKEL